MKILETSFLLGCTILTLTAINPVAADSLWTPGFSGYLSSESTVQAGDIVLVQIDASSSLSLQASSSDAKSITFEFSGGEFGNLFSFLPSTRTGGNQTVQGGQEYSLVTEIAVRVAEIDAAGLARLEGTRVFSVENKQELITIGGWIDPSTIGSDRRVSFSRLADARLQYSTFLQPSSPTITAADIEEIIETIEVPQAAAPAGTGEAGAPTTIIQESRGYQLTQEKKIELFLSYINRMVDLLFR